MLQEIAKLSVRERNMTKVNSIRNFLGAVTQSRLDVKTTWSPEEAAKIQFLAREVVPALPESIKSINFPNGGQMIFGEKDDPARIVEWDLKDVQKWAEHLEKHLNY
jgi:hypothetical protein